MSLFRETVLTRKPTLKPLGVGRFGAQLAAFPPTSVRGLLKFAMFTNKKTRGVPQDEMAKREVAVYKLDKDVLHFGVVPECVLLRLDDKVASVADFVNGLAPSQLVEGVFDKTRDDWKVRQALFWSKVSIPDATKIVLLDLIVNQVDRHGKNIIVLPNTGRLVAIDNGMTFGPCFRRYRSVIHRYLFLNRLKVPDVLVKHLRSITRNQIQSALSQYVGKREVEDTWTRLQFVLEHVDHLDYMTLSKGDLDKDGFPSYAKYFRRRSGPKRDLVLSVA